VLWHGLAVPAKLAVVMLFVVSMGPIYSGLFQASGWQASIGKRFLTIYVTDEAGRRLGLGRSLARSFAKDIFNSFYLGFVSLITIAVSTKKQALHDYAAKTLVVHGRPSMGGSLELWRIVAAFGIQFLLFVVTFIVLFRTIGRHVPMGIATRVSCRLAEGRPSAPCRALWTPCAAASDPCGRPSFPTYPRCSASGPSRSYP
jgi:hypothetical protein